MRPGSARRVLLVGLVVAVVLGFLLGWVARSWFDASPESRLRDTAEGIRQRIHEFTH